MQSIHRIQSTQAMLVFGINGLSAAQEISISEADHDLIWGVADRAHKQIEEEYSKLVTAQRSVPNEDFTELAYELGDNDVGSMEYKGQWATGIHFHKAGPSPFGEKELVELKALCARAFTQAAQALGASAKYAGCRLYTTFQYDEQIEVDVPDAT